jgi:hypothetical protein
MNKFLFDPAGEATLFPTVEFTIIYKQDFLLIQVKGRIGNFGHMIWKNIWIS